MRICADPERQYSGSRDFLTKSYLFKVQSFSLAPSSQFLWQYVREKKFACYIKIKKWFFTSNTLVVCRTPRPFPKIFIKRKVENIQDFSVDDFEVVGYEPHPKISMEMAIWDVWKWTFEITVYPSPCVQGASQLHAGLSVFWRLSCILRIFWISWSLLGGDLRRFCLWHGRRQRRRNHYKMVWSGMDSRKRCHAPWALFVKF